MFGIITDFVNMGVFQTALLAEAVAKRERVSGYDTVETMQISPVTGYQPGR